MKKRLLVPAAALLAIGLVFAGSTPALAATASFGIQSCPSGVRAGTYVNGYGNLTAGGNNGPTQSYGYAWTTPNGVLESHKAVFSVFSVAATYASASGYLSTALSGKGCYSSAAGKY